MLQPMRISSRENDKIKYVKKLSESAKFRKQEQLFFAEGVKLCQDLAQNLSCESIYLSKDRANKMPQLLNLSDEHYIVSDPVADKLASTKTSQGVYGVFKMPLYTIDELNIMNGVILCERIQDASNIGAIMRSAAAFGYGAILLSEGCADPYSPVALRASAGACGHIPVMIDTDLSEMINQLQKKDVKVVATALQDAQKMQDSQLEGACGLLIGNEGSGLSEDLLQKCDERIYIDMFNGMESLNAAVAASVVMFYYANKRG